jgi:4-amino-4-deoxy-L-arabinose transferase-like glycosyltransferase
VVRAALFVPVVRRIAPFAVGIVAIAIGAWRLMPGVGYWDTAEFQTVPPIFGTAHPTGYPTYVILGWLASFVLAPFGEAALRMNLLSAIFVGFAAGVTVDLVRRLSGSTHLGVAAGLGLAATPIVWRIATHADPHALHLTFVAILLWLFVRWEAARRTAPDRADRWLVAAAVVTGLSAGNHSLTLLLALPIALYVLAVEPEIIGRGRFFVACAAAFIVPTILVYLQLPLRGGAIPALRADLVYGSPGTLAGFAYVVTGEQFRGGIHDPFGNLPGKVAELAGLAARELGALAVLAPVGLFVTAVRMPAYALLTGSAIAITCFFNAAYVNAEIERYYLGPALIVWTWLAVLAGTVVDSISGVPLAGGPSVPPSELPKNRPESTAATGAGPPRRRSRLDALRPAATVLAASLLLFPTVGSFSARAAAVDRTNDRSAEEWLDAVLPALEPEAIVLSWWSYSTPLWYAQHIEGRRPDVVVADDRTRLDLDMGELTDVIDANLAIDRPVYAIRVDTAELTLLQARYRLTPLDSPIAAMVYRVRPRASQAVAP